MHEQYTDLVIPTLALHLGVRAREIAPQHDLFRDWGLTPLSLVVILLDLERIVALELPSQELSTVRTVADLTGKFRGWLRASAPDRARSRRGARAALATRNANGVSAGSSTSCAGSSKTRKLAARHARAPSPARRSEREPGGPSVSPSVRDPQPAEPARSVAASRSGTLPNDASRAARSRRRGHGNRHSR